MARQRQRKAPECQQILLGGVSYVILERTGFNRLCDRAGVPRPEGQPADEADLTASGQTPESLAERLVRRRKAVGLSQAALARRAGIRVETLNRIERGKTTSPDFATMRKIVVAIQEVRDEDD